MANMACIARRRPARFGAVVGSGGGGVVFVARGNIGRSGMADGASAKESWIETGGHTPILFNSCGLCCSILSRLSAITCMSRSRSSSAINWHWHNVTVVEMSTVVVVVVVVVTEERHFIVMVMGWWLVWKL